MARTLRVGAQGRLVLPSELRNRLGIEQGDELAIHDDGQRIVLEPRRELLRRMKEELQTAVGGGRSLVDELIAERRREAASEATR